MKKQENLKEETMKELMDVKWKKVETGDDAEVIKLNPGEQIEGLLIDKFISAKYNGAGVYKIKIKDDPKTKVILGTTILDKQMSAVSINTEILIKRTDDTKNAKGQNVSTWDVYSLRSSE